MRASNGNISATKLNASVGAYNDYVKALVGEVGPEKAIKEAPNGQKALQGLLGQLIQIANQSAPADSSAPPVTPPPAETPPAGTPPATPSTPEPTPPPAPTPTPVVPATPPVDPSAPPTPK